MAIGFTAFWVFAIILELLTGCAAIGWTGDKMVVQREKSPGPYWFAIILQSLIGIVLPLVFIFAA